MLEGRVKKQSAAKRDAAKVENRVNKQGIAFKKVYFPKGKRTMKDFENEDSEEEDNRNDIHKVLERLADRMTKKV